MVIYGKLIALGTVTLAGLGYLTKRILQNRALLAGASSRIGKKVKYVEGGFLPEMTRKEAAQILGVSENSQLSDIKVAHRTLIMKNHPDNGGSPFVSAKINEAKDMLTKKGGGFKKGDI